MATGSSIFGATRPVLADWKQDTAPFCLEIMEQGWIKLHRKLLENPISHKPLWGWLWVVLLLKANHADVETIWNGQGKTIEAGSFITGRKVLSVESGLSESTIERILDYLTKSGQIGQQKTNKYRLITILKWKEYQIVEQQKDNKKTTDGQQKDTNKNVKNDKNEKKLAKANSEAEYGNPQVNDLLKTLKEEFELGILDGSERENRQYAKLMLNKCGSLEVALKVIKVAALDDYWGDKIASVKKLYYHMAEIVQKAKSKKDNVLVIR